jgi:hypothetical protein
MPRTVTMGMLKEGKSPNAPKFKGNHNAASKPDLAQSLKATFRRRPDTSFPALFISNQKGLIQPKVVAHPGNALESGNLNRFRVPPDKISHVGIGRIPRLGSVSAAVPSRTKSVERMCPNPS